MGKVIDFQTKEPIPFVNITIKGTLSGTLTDFDGKYALELKNAGDSIKASLLGYHAESRKILKNQFQTINFELKEENLNLPELVIHYKGNPAEVILAKIINNREKNSLKSFDTYQYQAYTKIEVDANNITEKLKEKKIFKPFDFIFSYIDTSTINGKSYLPVFLTESVSDIYFRKNPKTRKEIIKAYKISGLENESVSHFLGNLTQQVDIYKDYIPIFDKNFVSPIASIGIGYYKYYLVDSAFMKNKWCYHIMFKPRRKQELTFSGNLWVNDTSFAITKIEARIAPDANINFINDLAIEQEFQWMDNKFWMKTRDYIIADFNILEKSKKVLGFFGHKTTVYSDFHFDVPENKQFTSQPTEIFTKKDAGLKADEYWQANRPEQLSKTEKGIYKMVDSIQKIPIYKTYVDVVYGIVMGYLTWGKLELGPYFKLFSFNELEGARFRLGGRTGNNFSKKLQLEGYLAYGTKDQRFKYSGDVIYMLSKNPRRDLTGFYKYDVEQLGMSPNAFSSDNILTSLFHRGPNNKLTMVREYKLGYEHEWYNGLINTIYLNHREVFPLGSTEFTLFPDKKDTSRLSSIFTSEIRFDTRFSFKERFISGEFYRYTLSSSYPIILLSYSYGMPKIFKSDFEYHKLTVNIEQWFNFSTIGWSKYIIESGKIWGKVPYPLLYIHDGNQTFLFDEYASNLMNYYEFASDAWLSVFYTHHFDGFFFNKIPLFRKLKWREVVYGRGIIGTLSSQNADYSKFPDHLRSFEQKPYWEAGAAVENIFRFIRVDAIWRLSHLHDAQNPNVIPFGIFLSLNFTF
ncbi:MAG: DUF5686 family protein [Bacteroidota bacterium]|nr:DUF5686 family protein [Bacteroidota bacterium]